MRLDLSSAGNAVERFLGEAGFDRGPWLVVAFLGGIALWFQLASPAQWLLAIGGGIGVGLAALAAWRGNEMRARLCLAGVALGLAMVAGTATIWARSELVGAIPIERPLLATLDGKVLKRIEQPSQNRVRLILATREPTTREGGGGRPIKVRVNLPLENDQPGIAEGAIVRLQARLMPPAAPMLPGGYNFARAAWFDGLAATGSVKGEVRVIAPGEGEGGLSSVQRRLSAHVRQQLGGSAGTIAAAFASGDRGAITQADDDAMRDSGLTHLLSISGLHVSAVIAAAYLLAIKLLALWPWLVLRVRLPLVASAIGAGSGIFYTLLTGAEVPTVRSCVGAVLVLLAIALGREPLSLRMIAVAALFVLLLWPEAAVGPSFQMSFAAVLSIVALYGSAPVRAFLGPREEGWLTYVARRVLMLLVTGVVVELALMPIGMFHFHRAGVYGALANVIAIPLVTFVSMPLIALALLLDLAGLGGPAWWLTGQSLNLLLALAHWTAGQPGAVQSLPVMGVGTLALFMGGGLWLALWRGRVRLLGLLPLAVAAVITQTTPAPDLLISGNGQQVAIGGEGERLLILRDSRSSFIRDNLLELSGMDGEPLPFAQWPGARCSRDFCSVTLNRGGRDWHLLMARSRGRIEERALAAACERADIVVADRWLPRSCQPLWLKADREMLSATGGLAITLADRRIRSVADSEGEHGWWRGADEDPGPRRRPEPGQ